MAAGASFRNLRHVGEHLTKDVAISQRTHHMKIGTAIMVLPSQHPLRVAEYAAMVDSLSGGRLMLGVGRGYQPPEFQGFGVAQEDSREMFEESFEIIRRALTGEKFAFDGKYWQIQEPTEIFPKPVQKQMPHCMAAISPASYELAAKHGISLLRSPQFTNLDIVAEAFNGYRTKMTENGFDADAIDQPYSVRTFVAPSDD